MISEVAAKKVVADWAHECSLEPSGLGALSLHMEPHKTGPGGLHYLILEWGWERDVALPKKRNSTALTDLGSTVLIDVADHAKSVAHVMCLQSRHIHL